MEGKQKKVADLSAIILCLVDHSLQGPHLHSGDIEQCDVKHIKAFPYQLYIRLVVRHATSLFSVTWWKQCWTKSEHPGLCCHGNVGHSSVWWVISRVLWITDRERMFVKKKKNRTKWVLICDEWKTKYGTTEQLDEKKWEKLRGKLISERQGRTEGEKETLCTAWVNRAIWLSIIRDADDWRPVIEIL